MSINFAVVEDIHKSFGWCATFKRPYRELTLLLSLPHPPVFLPNLHIIYPILNWKYCCCYSVTKLCLTLCDPIDCSTLGVPVIHYLLEFVQTHVHWVDDAIQPSHPLSPPSPPALNLSQHQGLFQWISSSHQVAELLEFQLQHQSFQWKMLG